MGPREIITGVILFCLSILLMQLIVRGFDIPMYVVPAPSDVIRDIVSRPDLYAQQTWRTFYETVLGFLLAVGLGLAGALLITYSRLLQLVLYPMILLLQIVPKVAIAPLLIIWVGFGVESKIIIALLIAFFPILVDTVTGLKAADPEVLDLVRVLNGSKVQEFTKVRLPNAIPYIFSGLKVAVTLAVIGAIIGEFVGGRGGLGYLIMIANGELRLDMSFAAITLLSLLGFALYGMVAAAQHLIAPWSAGVELEV
jgi:NitT/TauT family transport system permease protein